MSKRFDVLQAIVSMIDAALPGADVLGLDAAAAKPDRISPLGRVIVRFGSAGPPEVDLSPLSYNYEHGVPVEVAAFQSAGVTAAEAVDTMMAAIGAGVEADRSLGGLCNWLEAEFPDQDDLTTEGAAVAGEGLFNLVASYATPNPLT